METGTAAEKDREKRPIVVELENGLLKKGLYAEGLWALVRDHPLNIFRLLYWFITGNLEKKVGRILNSHKVQPPIDEEILGVIYSKKAEGYEVILKHTRHRELAQSLQYKLGCFSDLTARLPEHLTSRGFTYLTRGGDPDLWKKAHGGIFIGNAQDGAILKKSADVDIEYIEGGKQNLFVSLIRSLRPHQWSKSVLIFLSIIIAYRFREWGLWLDGLKAFMAFCLVSSSTYVVNDLFDLESDRQHPTNKKRPFAAGDVPLYWGAMIYCVLITCGLVGAYALSVEAFYILLGYSAIGLAYTFYLKRIPLLDTFILGALYVWRVFLGATVFGISLSPWLYMTGFAFFFSLANLKRVSELWIMGEGNHGKNRRGYLPEDKMVMMVFGVVSAFVACVLFPLYLQFNGRTNDVSLWFLSGIMAFWFSYVWLKTTRRKMHSDPVKFALTDFVSHICVLAAAAIWLLAEAS